MTRKDPAHPPVDQDTTQEKTPNQKRSLCERLEGVVVGFIRRFREWTHPTTLRGWSSGAVSYDECTHPTGYTAAMKYNREDNPQIRTLTLDVYDVLSGKLAPPLSKSDDALIERLAKIAIEKSKQRQAREKSQRTAVVEDKK